MQLCGEESAMDVVLSHRSTCKCFTEANIWWGRGSSYVFYGAFFLLFSSPAPPPKKKIL